jgi:hypothetical protein
MSDIIYHNHHIIPRHAGGSDDPSNIVRLTVEEHAEAHRILYETYGRIEDKIAWKMLSGKTSETEADFHELYRQAGLQSRGRHMSEEAREKISKANRGRKRPDVAEKNRKLKTGKTVVRSRESIDKGAASLKKYFESPEGQKKRHELSDRMKNDNPMYDSSVIDKVVQRRKKDGTYGNPHSPETRAKISAAAKTRYASRRPTNSSLVSSTPSRIDQL